MSYIALYRKFRPLKFSDMVGQDHISQILKNQIMSDRVGHAYLFSGIRGTGKTTTAKIFARAVNCLNPVDGEPCNECEICKSILDESLTDVTEIDAASNNGVDNIRDIREEVMYLPTKAKYRVYIIDEVHMLSTGAFNALLKTLEEPPKHVKFILATTEPNKLPATILSRCQRFDFKRISNDDIIARLNVILSEIGKTADENALRMIADISEGAMRDAISILDRCVTDQDNITLDYVRDLIGMPESISILQIVDKIVDNNPSEMLDILNEVLDSGKNVNVVLTDIIKKMQDILVYKVSGKMEIYSQDEIKLIEEIAKKVSTDKLASLIGEVSRIVNSVKWAENQMIVAQSQLIRLCLTTEQDSLEDLKRRIEKLEQGGVVASVPVKEEKKEVKAKAEKKVEEPKEEKVEKVEVKKEEVKKEEVPVAKGGELPEWKDVLDTLRERGKVNLYANLINATAQLINDSVLGIYFKVSFGKTMTEKIENINLLKDILFEITKKEYEIRCYLDEGEKKKSSMEQIEDAAKKLNIPMDIVDE